MPGAPADSSSDAVRILAETWHGEAELVARRLAVNFDEAPRRLRASIAKHLPDAVIVVASAPGAAELRVERLAVNLDDAETPDVAGNRPVDQPVVPGGENALWTTLPTKDIVAALTQRGLPARASMSPGSDVPNHVFYAMQRELSEWGVPSGLVLVPASPEMGRADVPALPPEVLAEALRVTVTTTVASLEQATEAPAEPGFDSEATQPYLMPIAEPIAEGTPAPPALVEAFAQAQPEPAPEPEPQPAPETRVAPTLAVADPGTAQVVFPDRGEYADPPAPEVPQQQAAAWTPEPEAPTSPDHQVPASPAGMLAGAQDAPADESLPWAPSVGDEEEAPALPRQLSWDEIIGSGR